MPGGTFHYEREQVAERLGRAIRRSLAAAKIPEVNDRGGYVFGRHAIGTHPSTREMRFFLEDLRAFTPELIARIRAEVLAEFPNWKVVPQFYTRTFTISAKSVDFGGRAARGVVTADTPAYQEWWRASVAFDEENFGVARRAFRFATARVPELLPRVAKEQFAFVAAVRKPKKGAMVWMLLSPALAEADFPEKGGPLQTFAVTADGAIHPEFCPDFSPLSGREPAAWLKVFDRPTAGAKAELVAGKGKKLGAVALEYVTDEDLKARMAERK